MLLDGKDLAGSLDDLTWPYHLIGREEQRSGEGEEKRNDYQWITAAMA